MTDTKQENNKIEGFEGEFLHPSLDIKNGVLLIGFRYMAKNMEEKQIFLIVGDRGIGFFSADSIELNGKKYFLDKEGKKLARIEERWSLQDLNDFIDGYNSGKSGVVPTPKEIYEEVRQLSKKYQELEKNIDYSLLTAWCIGVYFFPTLYAYPFLHIKAPKRSGKSQCLNFLKQICFNAVKARPSLAALGDTVDSLRGVYLIDQADSLKRKGNEDLVDILADSYKKGGGKRRVMDLDKRKGRNILEFNTYSPKAFASIGELPEDLRDRCFIIPLVRSQKNFPDPDEESENWKEIRGRLYKFLIDNYSLMSATYNFLKADYRTSPEIIGRELELWLPLEMIFKICSPEEIGEAKKRFRQLYGFTEYEPSEFEEAVVRVVLDSFPPDKMEVILSPKEISEGMDSEMFPAQNYQQTYVKVGWVIKKFNLSSEKLPRKKGCFQYLFKKEAVENIYKAYFKTAIDPTPPASEPKNELNNDNAGV